MIHVIIADDHPIVLFGIKLALSEDPAVMVTAEARNSTEIFNALQNVPCDVLVTDLHMPNGNYGDGLRMLEALRRKYPALKIVVVSMLDNTNMIAAIKRLGVQAIVSKNDISERVGQAVHRVFSGMDYESDTIRQTTCSYSFNASEQTLSRREIEVIRMLAEGKSVKQIADLRSRSTKTVSTQKVTAMRKLGLENDSQLVQYALANGLVQPTM